MQDKKQIMSSILIVIIVILIIWIFVYFNSENKPVVNGEITNIATSTVIEGDSPLDIFAKCVTDYGLTMYGAVWCSHCLNEKKAFGESFKYINYVECPDNIQLCVDAGINGYPTWSDKAGNKYEGEQGLSGLSKITACELPQ